MRRNTIINVRTGSSFGKKSWLDLNLVTALNLKRFSAMLKKGRGHAHTERVVELDTFGSDNFAGSLNRKPLAALIKVKCNLF